MAWTIEVNGVDRSGLIMDLNFAERTKDLTQDLTFQAGHEFTVGRAVKLLDGATTVYSGIIRGKTSEILPGGSVRWAYTCENNFANLRLAKFTGAPSTTNNKAALQSLLAASGVAFNVSALGNGSTYAGGELADAPILPIVATICLAEGWTWWFSGSVLFFGDWDCTDCPSPVTLTGTQLVDLAYQASGEIANRVVISQSDGSGEAEYSDATSKTAYGVRDLSIRSDYIPAGRYATVAAGVLDTFAQPLPLISFSIPTAYTTGQRVTIDSLPAGIAGIEDTYVVTARTVEWSAGLIVCNYEAQRIGQGEKSIPAVDHVDSSYQLARTDTGDYQGQPQANGFRIASITSGAGGSVVITVTGGNLPATAGAASDYRWYF